jgi:hypothetical protein
VRQTLIQYLLHAIHVVLVKNKPQPVVLVMRIRMVRILFVAIVLLVNIKTVQLIHLLLVKTVQQVLVIQQLEQQLVPIVVPVPLVRPPTQHVQ